MQEGISSIVTLISFISLNLSLLYFFSFTWLIRFGFLAHRHCSMYVLKLRTRVSYRDWKRSSGWLESWEGLLLVTDVSTTCAEAIFRVKW